MSSREPTRTPTIDKLWIFKTHPLFGRLGPDLQARLANYAVARRYRRGATIFSRGDPGTCLFSVVSGTVKISIQSPDAKDAVFRLVTAGGIFGEIALLDGQPRTADTVAATDCQLLVLERRDFVDLVHSHPDVALRIIEVLCERLRRTSDQVEDVMFLSLQGRLAKSLLRLMENGKTTPLGRKVAITQREIGEIIGMSRESTNKQLRAWQNRKWLKIERGSVTILRPEALAELASSGNP